MIKLPKAPNYSNPLQFITRHNPSNFKKAFEYALGWWAMCALRLLALALPRSFVLKLPEILAPLLAIIPFKRKKLVLENLKQAFPEISKEKLKKLFVRILRNAGRGLLELFIMERYSKTKVNEIVRAENVEIIENLHNEGRGIIVISAHFGTFTYGAMRLASEGYNVALLSKSQKDPVVDWYWRIIRLKQDIKDITEHPTESSIREMIQLLRNNGILYLQYDQRAPGEQPDTTFFNRPVHTYATPVKLANKTNAAIVTGYTYFSGRNHIFKISEPVALAEQITEQTEQNILQLLTTDLEKRICEHPDFWWWFHNRWYRYY